MRRTVQQNGFFLLALLGLGALPVQAFGSDDSVIAVLSSNLGPYKEALKGFQEAYGQPVPAYSLSEGNTKIPSGTRLIVAIGGKAATYPYPSKIPLLYLLAPGTLLRTFSMIRRVGSIHQRANSVGPKTPAQVSKICTASAPACNWRTR